jgi:hypothetical protein
MKIKLYSTVLLLTLLSACVDELNVEPRASIPDTNPIFDRVSAEQAVRGIYSALYYGATFESIGYLSGDNVQWTGSQSQVQEFINHRVNADNSTINGSWVAIYRLINRANNAIARIPGVTDAQLTDALRNQLIGEAHFLRALAYFDLARVWGGVPIVTNPTLSPTDNSGIARSSREETYQRVLADLQIAEELLPEKTERFRATRKTAWALRARLHLYRNQWDLAAEYASKLIDDSNYELVRPYGAFFLDNARGTRESVFEIFYNGTTEVNGHRTQWQPQEKGGTRQWAPSDAVVSLLLDPEKGGNRNVLIARDNQNRWYGNLYYRNPGSDPAFVIRIAELYLIRAEARAQLNDLQGALEDLNKVRDRAELPALDLGLKEEVLLAIEDERRLEFAFEPHRWFDLVRTGRAQEVLSINEPWRLLLPLPISQLQIDHALEQNEGY